MTVYAVVPVKKLADSKKRLSKVLSPHQRRWLTIAMLEDVLTVLKASNVDKIVVVGEDAIIKEIAQKSKADYVAANGANLNTAIEHAQNWCIEKGANSILVLPADLPLVQAKDIDRILELGAGAGKAVVLTASKNWGTNALYQNPPKLIPACFGARSWQKHIQEAYSKGVSVRLTFSEGLSSDIDSGSDLKMVFHAGRTTYTGQVLEQIKLSNENLTNI
jgi:2-phospho-L-lactate/phosphoenolpyruvate guanylyltransferase